MKKQEYTIELSKLEKFNKTKDTSLPEFKRAAKRVAKEMKQHFKKDGWDLSYGQYVADVFYYATGHHLESYLLEALKGENLAITFKTPHGLVFRKITKKRTKRANTKR